MSTSMNPEKHYSRKRDGNLTVACLSARKWSRKRVRDVRLCRSKTKTGSVSLPKGREDSRKGIFFKILVDTFVVHGDIVYVEWLR